MKSTGSTLNILPGSWLLHWIVGRFIDWTNPGNYWVGPQTALQPCGLRVLLETNRVTHSCGGGETGESGH